MNLLNAGRSRARFPGRFESRGCASSRMFNPGRRARQSPGSAAGGSDDGRYPLGAGSGGAQVPAAVGLLEARRARGAAHQDAGLRRHGQDGLFHRPVHLVLFRGRRFGRRAFGGFGDRVRFRARPRLYRAGPRPRDARRRARGRVPLGGRAGRDVCRGVAVRRRASLDFPGLEARGRRALPQGARRDVRPRPVLHRHRQGLARLRGGFRQSRRRRAGLPDLDRAFGREGAANAGRRRRRCRGRRRRGRLPRCLQPPSPLPGPTAALPATPTPASPATTEAIATAVARAMVAAVPAVWATSS